MDTDGLRRGQWSDEEDTKLSDYVALHGVANWNSLPRLAGLERTGKSCRLRWLNYLRPDLRHGSFSLEEKLQILQLHLTWGNKWSKIAQQLPGRTDNEIKNYWRTKVQKLAKELKYEMNSHQFRDALRHIWMPRLVEQMQGQSSQLGPSYAPPVVNQFGYNGPYGEPICPNSGCLFDPTWAQTSSQNWHVNGLGPSDWHAAASDPMDSPEAHVSPTDSGPSATTPNNLAHSQTWEEKDKSYEYDQLLEILLSYEDNPLLYYPMP